MKTIVVALISLCVVLSLAPRGAAALPVTNDWSQQFTGSWSWSAAGQQASNLVEGGFSDWRLPTRMELVGGIQSGTLPALTPGSYYYWTSEKKGNRAWAVVIVADSNGDPIVAQSGSATLILQSSFVHALATRP